MTVKELIRELSKFDPEIPVFVDHHGGDDDMEVIGCYKQNSYDDDNNFLGTAIMLYEY